MDYSVLFDGDGCGCGDGSCGPAGDDTAMPTEETPAAEETPESTEE